MTERMNRFKDLIGCLNGTGITSKNYRDTMNEENGYKPMAFLFINGGAAFYDLNKEQMSDLQEYGWKGLHRFMEMYPTASVFVQGGGPIPLDLLRLLMNQIRELED